MARLSVPMSLEEAQALLELVENQLFRMKFIDSKIADWAMMVNPNSTFSPDASQAVTQALSSQNQAGFTDQLGAQEFNPAPIPEPTTIAIWGLADMGEIDRDADLVQCGDVHVARRASAEKHDVLECAALRHRSGRQIGMIVEADIAVG